MGNFLANTWAGGLVKYFASLVLGGLVLYMSNGGSLAAIKGSDVMTWVSAALVVVLPVIINALNPADARYGRAK